MLLTGPMAVAEERPLPSLAFKLVEEAQQHTRLQISPGSLSGQAQLILTLGSSSSRAPLAVVLSDSNGHWWRYHAPLRSSQQVTLPLAQEHWSGPHGPLDADAKARISAIALSSSAPPLRLERLSTRSHSGPGQVDLIRVLDPAPQPEGSLPWYTLRLQVQGQGIERVDLARPNHRLIPAFRSRLYLDHGPEVWQVRLRSDEIELEQASLIVRGHGGRVLAQQRLVLASETPPQPPRPSNQALADWPILTSPPWSGLHAVITHQGQQVTSRSELPEAVAPILAWRDDWSGFVGLAGINHHLAQAFDAHLASQAPSDVDLLPDFLWRDEGIYRFANAPWHQDHGGPLQHPMDAWDYPALWQHLQQHAREVIARSRAAPSLQRWRISSQLPIAHPDQHGAAVFRTMDAFAALISQYDYRPLHMLHPASIPYRRSQGEGLALLNPNQDHLQLDAQGSARTRVDLDQSLWTWERSRYQVSNPSPSGISLYAWMSDRHHRYYQQRLAYLPANSPPQVIEVAWGKDARWQAVGHDLPWDISLRDRVRSLGLLLSADDPGAAGQRIPITTLPLVGWPADPSPRPALNWLKAPQEQAQTWQPYHLHFQLTPQVDNPYDPGHADVMAELIDPQGTEHRFPAFWYEPHDFQRDSEGHEQVLPSAHGHWAWRYAFSQPGTWRLRMVARLDWRGQYRNLETPWHEIEVTAAANPTLPVRTSEDQRYWQTSDGEWFYPMGITLRSPGDDRQDILLRNYEGAKGSAHWQALGTEAYAHWFARMAEQGGNFARIWMSPWWTGLEWNRAWDDFQGLGRYNQANAARMDRLVELAAEHGIYLQIELLNHGMTSETVDQQWHPDPDRREVGSPYNTLNGGPVERAAEFFSDETSWQYHRNRLRYTVARWGHAPEIMAWVLSSEMEFTGAFWNEAYLSSDRNPHSPTLQAWIERNLDWFQAHDHHQRPVSIHFSHPWRAGRMWRMDGLGFSYSNAYTGYQTAQGQLGGRRAGLRGAFFTYMTRHFPPWDLNRPTMLGEWGGHWMERDPQVLEDEFAPGLWMQAVMPFAGNTGFWWWLWVDASDSWHHMAPVRRFIQDMDPRGHDLRATVPQVIAPSLDHGRALQAIGSRSDTLILCYLYDSQDRRRGVVGGDAEDESIQVLIRSIPPNRTWSWHRYDANSGKRIGQGSVRSSNQGTILLPVRDFMGQAAWRLEWVE